MIKIENVEVCGLEPTIRGMRNPHNSWDKSDSRYCNTEDDCEGCPGIKDKKTCDFGLFNRGYVLGPKDLYLGTKLAIGGPVHAKYRRMITVYMDITAPLYWWAEMDTYKVGTVRNSCSFMHKGTSKPFEIDDFSIKNEKVYEVLRMPEKKEYTLIYPYETNEYKTYVDYNGRKYKVYKNGRVIREAFEYIDNWGSGRKRQYEESEATIWQNSSGYFIVNLSGRGNKRISLHRLVAELWCEKKHVDATQVNHIDGNKGNNSADNLEWVSPSENVQKAFENGLYDNVSSLQKRYKLWKNGIDIVSSNKRISFKIDINRGLSYKELADKYHITPQQANNLRYDIQHYEYEDLFQECYAWDELLNHLNHLRNVYLETNDLQVFQEIRCLLPQGYKQRSTLMLNYEVLHNIYTSRRTHKLDEWREFCEFIVKELPYSVIFTTGCDSTLNSEEV